MSIYKYQTYIILIQEHMKLSDGDSQVSFVKLVRNVPTKRSKLTSLLYKGVEKAKTEEQTFESLL